MFSKRRVAGYLLVALLLTGSVAGYAFAQSGPQGSGSGQTLFQDFVARFATNLGVNQDQVLSAFESTKKQMLDEAVQQGRLTREQADKMAAKMGNDKGWAGFFGGKGMRDGGRPFGRNLDGAAGVLGLTADQLKQELQSGKTMQQIVEGHGLTMDQFKQQMLDAQKQDLAKKVSDGKLTQEQADKIISRMGNDKGWAGFFGGKGMRDGGRPFGRNLDSVAGVLGVAADQLKQEMQSGKNMQQIIEGHGLTLDQFHQKMLEVQKQELAKKV
ncbi:MAG: DUF2680 domain-containing protein, partial [Eubacteriales bacterium]